MKLLIGLGNPGQHFDGTRHNVGFLVLENLAAKHGLEWVTKEKFKASVAEGLLNGQKVLLAKPQTYYNLSGEAAQALKQFYKVDNQDILVVHDELDLPFGTVRARRGGSDAGNNGIKSITAHLGEDVARVRIGVANEQRGMQDPADFVLGHFSHEEREQLQDIVQQSHILLHGFVADDFNHTTVTNK